MTRYILLMVALSFSNCFSKEPIQLEENLFALISTNSLDPNVIGLELGMTHRKEFDGKKINPTITGMLYQQEIERNHFDSSAKKGDKTYVAGMGVKAGVLIPTSRRFGLSALGNLGMARTAVQSNPWFGKREENLDDRSRFLIEAGVMYYCKWFVAKFVYHYSTAKYSTHNLDLALGVNF